MEEYAEQHPHAGGVLLSIVSPRRIITKFRTHSPGTIGTSQEYGERGQGREGHSQNVAGEGGHQQLMRYEAFAGGSQRGSVVGWS